MLQSYLIKLKEKKIVKNIYKKYTNMVQDTDKNLTRNL